MLNENAQKWVDALRSGEYKQGRACLAGRGPDGTIRYCCLGVACEVYIKEGNELSKQETGGRIYYNGEPLYLPYEVKDWLGLRDRHGVSAGQGTILPNENDMGTPFDKIADMIVAEPEGLFINKEKNQHEKSN